jgi:hypothetical protein
MNSVKEVSSSSSVAVIECKIIGSNGQVKDLKEPLIFNQIQIHESIYSPVITGTIQLVEGVNLYSLLSMHGNEYLYLSFCRPGEDERDQRYTRTFRIYKSDFRMPTEGSQTQTYVLHFCSDELVFANQQTLSRSLTGLSSSEYIYKILNEDLKVNKKRIKLFEKSQGIHNFVLTKYKPFEAIEFLTKYSYNENNSPFLFFENRDGYNFISLEKLLQQNPVASLKYDTAPQTRGRADIRENSIQVERYKFEQGFNVLEGTENGVYANRLYTLDLIRQKYSKIDYSTKNEAAKQSMMDGFFPINDAVNRNNRPLSQEYNSQPNYWLTNLNQNETPYFISKRFRTINTDIENILLQRKAQLNLLKNTRVECLVPGNPNYSVGYVIEFNLPPFIPNSPDDLDPYYAGKYLITNIRHSITSSKLDTNMLLSKNSVKTELDKADNGNRAYKTAREF